MTEETSATAQDTTALDATVVRQKPRYRRAFGQISRVVGILVVVAGLGYWAQTWVRNSLLYVTETDARIMADFVVVGATASGEMTARAVN